MLSRKKISVIIPTYGGKSSLDRAIESVLLQDYKDFEIIVVDDNEPGTEERSNTEVLMEQFSLATNVIYIKHEHNKNGSAARNTGFRASSGEYICLLDDDDVFLQNKLKLQADFLDNNIQYGGCYCWRKQYGKVISSELEGNLSESLLDLSFTPYTSSLMLRRECYEALNGFDEKYRRHQDFEFLLRFYEKYKLGVVKEVLLEIVGNEVNNQPHGKKLYNVKNLFFNQFISTIEIIDKEKPGFMKRVYAVHSAAAFKDCLRYFHPVYAIKFYFKYGIKAGSLFWKHLCFLFSAAFKERISGDK